MNRLTPFGWLLLSLALTNSLTADEPPRARPAGGERRPDAGGRRRSEFPEEIKLTDAQQTQLNDLRTEFAAAFAELMTQRDAVLADEQKTARREAEQKIRAGSLGRQEAADLLAAALNLSADQKARIEVVDREANKRRADYESRKTALLTAEQKATLRKLTTSRELDRTFALPGEFELTDAQKSSLKALQDELRGDLVALTEARDAILTDERKAARDAVYKEAREKSQDRQTLSDALDAALRLSDAEKTQLAETERNLGALLQKVSDRKLDVLTAEQKQEFERKFGSRRPRN